MTDNRNTNGSNDSTESQPFTAINPTCPICGSALDLLHGEIVVSGENGAHVPAYCSSDDCEWNGTASYRMMSLDPR